MSRNPRVIRLIFFLFTPLRWIFRLRVEGLDGIPERPCVLVANHSIGAALEVFGILYAWEKRFGFRYDHPVFGLAHHLAFRVPILSTIMRGAGAIPADFPDAKRALDSGASILVFPGGNWEATRSFWRGNEVDFGGHRGWIRVAKNSGAEILPIAIAGSYAVNPVLGRSRILAKLSLFELFLRVRWLPLSVGQFLWAGLFMGLTLGHLPLALGIFGGVFLFLFTPLVPIWPARVTIRFGTPFPATGSEAELEEKTVSWIRSQIRLQT